MLQKGLYKKGHDNVFNVIISIIEVALLLFFVFFTLSKWIANNNKDGIEYGPGYIPKFEDEEIIAEDSEDTETEETADESEETDIGESENGEAAVETGDALPTVEENIGNNAGFEEEEELNGNSGATAGEETNGIPPGFEEEEEPGENGNGSSDNPSEDESSSLPPKAPTQDGEWGNPINN